MKLWVEAKAYRRRFLRPLETSYGAWRWREGVLIQLQNSAGALGYGEVCPLPWFGTETLETAKRFWQSRTGWLALDEFLSIPASLPATQFAAETALSQLKQPERYIQEYSLSLKPADLCGLLPAGEKAFAVAAHKVQSGYRTLKWKIGVFPVDQEIVWLETLTHQLEGQCHLRLDANGGLTYPEAELWLSTCDRLNSGLSDSSQAANSGNLLSLTAESPGPSIEYLEQPLSPQQFEAMGELCMQHQTFIALDESITGLEQLEQHYLNGWSGFVVIKPTIAGAPTKLQQLLTHWGQRVIFSSAFETKVGRQAALQFALNYYHQTFSGKKFPALGFDTLGYFNDNWDQLEPQQLWEHI
jgi:O-succinylbenzoate synthase